VAQERASDSCRRASWRKRDEEAAWCTDSNFEPAVYRPVGDRASAQEALSRAGKAFLERLREPPAGWKSNAERVLKSLLSLGRGNQRPSLTVGVFAWSKQSSTAHERSVQATGDHLRQAFVAAYGGLVFGHSSQSKCRRDRRVPMGKSPGSQSYLAKSFGTLNAMGLGVHQIFNIANPS